ncbi:MAG: hypothetical protein ACP6IT_00695, partial [Candidatus Thorarchaeota archaeon]
MRRQSLRYMVLLDFNRPSTPQHIMNSGQYSIENETSPILNLIARMAPSVTETNVAKFEDLIRRALRNTLVSIDVTGWAEEAVKALLHVMSTG